MTQGSSSSVRSADSSDSEDIHNSTVLEVAARAGLTVYGLVHILFTYVAIRLVFTDAKGSSTGTGALRQLAKDEAGRWLLAVVAAGLALLVAWQLITAAVGYRRESGWRRHLMRFGALTRATVYGYLCASSGKLALQGQDGSSSNPDSMSAKLMSAPAGAVILTLIGLIVIGVGVGQIVFGLMSKFLEQLDDEAKDKDRRIPIRLIGQVGYVAKGIALGVVGALLCWAAMTHDPKKSGGLDSALFRLLGENYGKVALVAVGGGIAVFGVYTLIRSRHIESDALTS